VVKGGPNKRCSSGLSKHLKVKQDQKKRGGPKISMELEKKKATSEGNEETHGRTTISNKKKNPSPKARKGR